MATGTGKTRTAAALIKRLFQANAITRVLFLVDRITLARQTEDAFAAHLPEYPAYVLRAGRGFQISGNYARRCRQAHDAAGRERVPCCGHGSSPVGEEHMGRAPAVVKFWFHCTESTYRTSTGDARSAPGSRRCQPCAGVWRSP
jgi:hypothetical protein